MPTIQYSETAPPAKPWALTAADGTVSFHRTKANAAAAAAGAAQHAVVDGWGAEWSELAPPARPWQVVNGLGEVAGFHASKAAAQAQVAELKRFNPRQRRDAHGRWTEVGGSGGTTTTPRVTTEWSVDQLQGLWGDLDRDLLPYAGHPEAPEARKIIRRQKAIVKVLHHKNRRKNRDREVRRSGDPHDVVVVGSGPAGLSAAIYGGTEGLDTVMLDANDDPGGQARMSTRIENVLGFPAGVTGSQYAGMGLEQARRTGADTQFNTRVEGLKYDPKTKLKTLTVSRNGRKRTLKARAVVLAGGVQFRHLAFPGADSKGIVYGSSEELVRQTGADGHAVIVGGANSAGQAAIATASEVDHVTILIRGPSIEDKMSKYLVDQLRGAPNVTIRENEEVGAAIPGEDGKVSTIRYKNSGEEEPVNGLAVFVGSAPTADWAGVDRDEKGFIKANPSTLETSIPGVYAAGDVRANSVHRVITAAADGAMAISQVHGFLPQVQEDEAKAERGDIEKVADRLPNDEADDWLDRVDELDLQVPFTGGDEEPGESAPGGKSVPLGGQQVYRAWHMTEHPESVVGQTIRDREPVLTSESDAAPLKALARVDGGHKVLVRIQLKADLPVVKQFGREVLLPRGSQFTVTAVDRGEAGVWLMDLVPV